MDALHVPVYGNGRQADGLPAKAVHGIGLGDELDWQHVLIQNDKARTQPYAVLTADSSKALVHNADQRRRVEVLE